MAHEMGAETPAEEKLRERIDKYVEKVENYIGRANNKKETDNGVLYQDMVMFFENFYRLMKTGGRIDWPIKDFEGRRIERVYGLLSEFTSPPEAAADEWDVKEVGEKVERLKDVSKNVEQKIYELAAAAIENIATSRDREDKKAPTQLLNLKMVRGALSIPLILEELNKINEARIKTKKSPLLVQLDEFLDEKEFLKVIEGIEKHVASIA